MKVKKRAGRPPKGSGLAKSQAILLRLRPGEKEAFKTAAGVAGIDLSAWMRERLRQAAIRELEGASQPIAFLKSFGDKGDGRSKQD